MKTTILYKRDGEKIEIRGGLRKQKESYDATIDKPMAERILEKYRDLEARGELKDHDCEGGMARTRDVWRREAELLNAQED